MSYEKLTPLMDRTGDVNKFVQYVHMLTSNSDRIIDQMDL